MLKKHTFYILILFVTGWSLLFPLVVHSDDEITARELWEAVPNFQSFGVKSIAVLPLDNLSLEPHGEKALYDAVYSQLSNKGYSKIDKEYVRRIMSEIGIKTSGQLAGISLKRLGELLNVDAVLMGQIDQSGAVHTGVYDAVVVSCSLRLIHCKSGTILWKAEQWRTAHRQWQLDPVNMLVNFFSHEYTSRDERLQWLGKQMLTTLPVGPIKVEKDNLLEQAVEVNTSHADN